MIEFFNVDFSSFVQLNSFDTRKGARRAGYMCNRERSGCGSITVSCVFKVYYGI